MPNPNVRPSYKTMLKSLPVLSLNAMVSLYYRHHGLSPSTLHLHDGQTSIHLWSPAHPLRHKPNLVMLHGYGTGDLRWQFMAQLPRLAQNFNLYTPDLVFFGGSYSTRPERTVRFQAECVYEGLKTAGVGRFSVFAVSYGGFVGYKMAEMFEEMVEKVVIVSSGIVCGGSGRKTEHLKKFDRNVMELLVPETPVDVRTVDGLGMYKTNLLRWIPDFFIQQSLNLEVCIKEKREMLEELLLDEPDTPIPILNQETLIIWGDKDVVFPVDWAYELQRHLGAKSKLEILKDIGHAAHVEAPDEINRLIISFIIGSSN